MVHKVLRDASLYEKLGNVSMGTVSRYGNFSQTKGEVTFSRIFFKSPPKIVTFLWKTKMLLRNSKLTIFVGALYRIRMTGGWGVDKVDFFLTFPISLKGCIPYKPFTNRPLKILHFKWLGSLITKVKPPHPTHSVSKWHGYGGYIRVITLEGWGKKSGRINSFANQVLFWVNLSNIYEILSTNQDYMTEGSAFVPQK